MSERRLIGTPAAPGLAIGPLVALAELGIVVDAPVRPPEEEAGRLRAALTQAAGDLDTMIEGDDGAAADILGFQMALLEDDELTAPVLRAIADGRSAASAWRARLEEEIAGYRAAEDAYFRARASDLEDLRDRVSAVLTGAGDADALLPEGAIVTASDLTPSRFLRLDWSRLGGAALAHGSPAAHVALLARARGVPLLTGLGAVPEPVAEAMLDIEAASLVLDPSPLTRSRCADRLAAARAAAAAAGPISRAPAITAAGERVLVMVNLDHPDAVPDTVLAAADGVGLFRTEFLFIGRDHLPGEAEQLATYVAVLERLEGRPCIVRTLDVGGDKPLPGVSLAAESNPFLGLRGLRLCLERPGLFRPQVRALLRAAIGRPLEVMLPMVTVAGEIGEARALFEAELAALHAAGIPAAMPRLGIMVEVPAAALAIGTLDADFYSIGSNDLVQYVMAASRDAGGRVARLADPLHPAVLELIGRVVEHGRRTGREVSLCGDMAGDPACLAALLGLGLRKVSVAATALGRAKQAVAAFGAA